MMRWRASWSAPACAPMTAPGSCPSTEEYAEQLKSNFADFANIGGREGGAITAAAFLAKFTQGMKWAHLDIAGTAYRRRRAQGQHRPARAAAGRLPDPSRRAVMQKVYAPPDIERRIYAHWEAHGWFAPRPRGGAPYCIVIPPPNVTGTLHMGHAFQHTIMDALTRYHRMRGDETLWQPGTDHAGIATQMVVERQLEAEGTQAHQTSGAKASSSASGTGRTQSGGTISAQMRRLGASVDWSRERFTMDADLSRAVTEVFVRLHDEGLIYRGKRLVNWDPVLLTALSDLEVQSEEEDGQLWHLRYPLADGSGHIVVATTRPETMLGDTAVAVNPEDDRYQKLDRQGSAAAAHGARHSAHRR